MAGCKKKKVKAVFKPDKRQPNNVEDPNAFYAEYPSWRFVRLSDNMWGIKNDADKKIFMEKILPFLQNLEKCTWSDILIKSKKQNHLINVQELNHVAIKELEKNYIEAESIISLRMESRKRLYGYMSGSVFNLIWYDDKHGDNDNCVCRCHKKHT